MLPVYATAFLLAVMSAVRWCGVADAERLTPKEIESITIRWRCPPNGTVPNKATVNATVYKYNATLLHWAARYECIDLMRRLLALQANKLARDVVRDIPLHWAARRSSDGAAALLLADGDADRRRMARNRCGRHIPLHIAAWTRNPAVGRLLVANCTDRHLHAQLAARGNNGETPLCFNKHQAIVDEIVSRDSCPSNPAFISQMLRGQTDEQVIQRTKQAIAKVSKTSCTDKRAKDNLIAELAVLSKGMAKQKQMYETQIGKLTKSAQICTAKLNNVSCEDVESAEKTAVLKAEKTAVQKAEEAAKCSAILRATSYKLDLQLTQTAAKVHVMYNCKAELQTKQNAAATCRMREAKYRRQATATGKEIEDMRVRMEEQKNLTMHG